MTFTDVQMGLTMLMCKRVTTGLVDATVAIVPKDGKLVDSEWMVTVIVAMNERRQKEIILENLYIV